MYDDDILMFLLHAVIAFCIGIPRSGMLCHIDYCVARKFLGNIISPTEIWVLAFDVVSEGW